MLGVGQKHVCIHGNVVVQKRHHVCKTNTVTFTTQPTHEQKVLSLWLDICQAAADYYGLLYYTIMVTMETIRQVTSEESRLTELHVRGTCEVVEAVVLEDFVQDAQQLPHLGGDGLTGEAERQRQDLLVKF